MFDHHWFALKQIKCLVSLKNCLRGHPPCVVQINGEKPAGVLFPGLVTSIKLVDQSS
jgi:hypothetical protein